MVRRPRGVKDRQAKDALFAFNCQDPPNLLASICDPPALAGIGDANDNAQYDTQDAVFIWAYAERTVGLIFLRGVPTLDPLRSDPRFQDLLRRIGFPES